MKSLLCSLLTIPLVAGCGDTGKMVWDSDTGTRTNTGDQGSDPGANSDTGSGDQPDQSDSGDDTTIDTATPSGEDTATPTGEDTATPTGEDTATPTGEDTATPTGEDTGSSAEGDTADTAEEVSSTPTVPVFDFELVYHPPDFVYAEASIMDTIYATPADWDGDGDGDLVIFNDWTGDASVSYQVAPRTFDPPEPVANPIEHALDALRAHHDAEFTSTNISVVRTTPILVDLDGSEGVIVQLQAARGSSWLAPSYNPVVLSTADGNTLLTTERTTGARILRDLNGDGLPEILLGYEDGGADILWNADPDIRTPLPLDVILFMKFDFKAEVAVTNPETGEFILYTGGAEVPSRHTVYRLQADETAVTILDTIDIGYIPSLVVANPEESTPQSILAIHYDHPVTRFRGAEGVTVRSDVEATGVTEHPTRYVQVDAVGEYDLIELNPHEGRWSVWLDTADDPMMEHPLTFTDGSPGSGEYDGDLFIRDLDGDNRADIIKCHVSAENYYQRIWWNNAE